MDIMDSLSTSIETTVDDDKISEEEFVTPLNDEIKSMNKPKPRN